MKLEVGMYVRTNLGIILKIFSIDNERKKCVYDQKHGFEIFFSQINKASHNILDLIIPCDLLFIAIDDEIIIPRIAETLAELKEFINNIESGKWILRGIVTKEQLENNCYKIGDEENAKN